MKPGLFVFGLTGCLFLACASRSPTPAPVPLRTAPEPSAPAGEAPPTFAHAHWSYVGDSGPSHWGLLEANWSSCATGQAQSPIDLTGAVEERGHELATDFRPTSLRIIHQSHAADVLNTGHSLQVNFPGGDVLSIGSEKYELKQFHFHTPSEHTVDGKHFPMELHLVHQDAGGRLAVLGIFFLEGEANAGIAKFSAHLPSAPGVEFHLPEVNADGSHVLPKDRSAFRYQGSLTTPPCSEGVQWLVFTTPVSASSAQIEAISRLIGENARPTQPLHGRILKRDPLFGEGLRAPAVQ